SFLLTLADVRPASGTAAVRSSQRPAFGGPLSCTVFGSPIRARYGRRAFRATADGGRWSSAVWLRSQLRAVTDALLPYDVLEVPRRAGGGGVQLVRAVEFEAASVAA